MHWSCFLLFFYIVLSQHAFLTVFNDSSQLPAARAGDLGIFRLFAAGSGFLELELLQNLQADLQALTPGAVVLYKTNESENGLKLATVIQPSKDHVPDTKRSVHSVLHYDVSLRDLLQRRFPGHAIARELGVWLRRHSDECDCADAYEGLPRDFVKPVAEIHGVLWTGVPWMGLPILLLHRIKIFLAGAGIAGGLTTLTWSILSGQHVTLYDLDLDTRSSPRRSNFVWGCFFLCTVVAYVVYKMTVLLIGVTSTTVVGVFCFLYAGLHDVALDCLTWLREYVEDEITARVGGPAYYGWPVRGKSDVFYTDDLSYAHAQGEGLSNLVLLRGRLIRHLTSLARRSLSPPFPPPQHSSKFGSASSTADRSNLSAEEKNGNGKSDRSQKLNTESLKCRISNEVMVDPVIAADGYSYERKCIEDYLKVYNSSPVSGKQLAFKHVVSNNQLRNVIEAYRRGLDSVTQVEEELRCPITMCPMRDAVVTCDGHSYEREAIIRWLRRHETSPKSNLLLGNKALITNQNLAKLATSLIQQND